jgi:hypothetical protein
MSKTPDRADLIAATVYPFPSSDSTGDEDTYNERLRNQLARKIRAAIRAERRACVKVIEDAMDTLDVKKQPAEIATCWALLDILAPVRTIKPKRKARK